MPLFGLGLTKLPCFRTDSRADARAVWMTRIMSLPIDRLLPAVHPRFLPVPLMAQEKREQTVIPERLPITAERLDATGVFILENGFDMYIVVGQAVDPKVLRDLFNVGSMDALDPSNFADMPNLDNPVSQRCRQIIAELRRQRRSYMHLRLVKKGHMNETMFSSSLVEDRHPATGMSYVEFLCFLHRQIQNKIQ